jgi:hypothetical protein
MGDRSGSFPGCVQVKIKMCRKDYSWYVRLVYDSMKLPEVTTARSGVTRVLQVSSTDNLTLPSFHVSLFRGRYVPHRFCASAPRIIKTPPHRLLLLLPAAAAAAAAAQTQSSSLLQTPKPNL